MKRLNKQNFPEFGEFYQTFEELMPILFILFQKIKEEETFPYTFYEFSITLIPKLDTTRKLKSDISMKNDAKLIN
jgi:hypothetical protein